MNKVSNVKIKITPMLETKKGRETQHLNSTYNLKIIRTYF